MALARRKRLGKRRRVRAGFNASARRNELLRHWSKVVKARDGHRCAKCRSTRLLQAHHIFHQGSHPSARFYTPNGICLCSSCHAKLHWQGEAPFIGWLLQNWFVDIAEWEALRAKACRSNGTWGPAEYDRDLAYLNDEAMKHGVETI